MVALFVILIGVVLWIVLRPAWLPTPPDNQVTASVAANARAAYAASERYTTAAAASGRSLLSATSERIGRVSEKWTRDEWTAQFKVWCAGPMRQSIRGYVRPVDAGRIAKWLGEFSEAEMSALAREAAAFCRRLKLDPNSLSRGGDAAVQSAIEEALSLFVIAAWRAGAAAPSATPVKAKAGSNGRPARTKRSVGSRRRAAPARSAR